MNITLCVCTLNNSEVLLIEVMLGRSLAMTLGVVRVIDSE